MTDLAKLKNLLPFYVINPTTVPHRTYKVVGYDDGDYLYTCKEHGPGVHRAQESFIEEYCESLND